MIKVLFVCHGNICRSPMSEFLFKDMVLKANLSDLFYIESAATSDEEIGNPVHYGTKKILDNLNIDCSRKRARQIKKEDYKEFDYIICMDSYNERNLLSFFKQDTDNKIKRLLDYTMEKRDVIDPWYSGNFQQTYEDIMFGLKSFLNFIITYNK